MRIKHLKKKEIFKKENLIPEPTIDVVKSITDIAKFLNPTDDGLFLENGEMKSPNFVRNLKGWKIDSQGNAYFKSITAGSYIQVFVQATVPTSVHINDIWYDSDDNNKMYVAEKAGADQITAGEWVERNNPTEWADVQDGASTKPVNNATVGAVFGTNISGGGAGDGQVSNAGYVGGLGVSKLIAGTILSKAITLAVSAGTGDVKIQAGKTDFGDNTAGFILGIDDSDSDKAKFEIGNSTDYLKWDGSNVKMLCSSANAIHIQYGSDILLEHGGDIKFTSVTAPTACTAALIEAAGNVDAGTHNYKVTFVNESGETKLGTVSNTVTNDGTHEQNALTGIPVSSSNSVTARKIYRTKAGGTHYYLLTEIADNTGTTYTDNIADANLTGGSANNMRSSSFGKIWIDGIKSLDLEMANTWIGIWSGRINATGYGNIGIGARTFYYNTEGFLNVAVGDDALFGNTTGQQNIAIGKWALSSNTIGSYNVALGQAALDANTEGNENTAVGAYALDTNITGSKNVAIGRFAGRYETGSDKLFIDNASRNNEADGRIKALIYGIFNSAVADQTVRLNASVGINTVDFGSGKVVLALANASTVPSANPTGGGVIYCEGGALKYRGSSGTITTLGAA